MKYILSSLVFLLSINTLATTKVAILDTGLDINKYNKHLCPDGHKDFTGEGLEDVNTHGTNIHGIISEADGDYCIVILKIFGEHSEDVSIKSGDAIKYAKEIGVKIINYSGGGYEYNSYEATMIKSFIDNGGTFIAAAGNEGYDINVKPFYPAMDDDRVIVVGNTNYKHYNKGKRINIIIEGNNITANDVKMSGSSQSTAIYTRNIINSMR